MAYRISQLLGLTVNYGAPRYLFNNGNTGNLIRIATPQLLQSRNSQFFNRTPVEQLWKSTTSVSNPGRKRGRAKGLGRRVNIYNVIGKQVPAMQFPGFSAPVKRGNTFISQRPVGSTEKLERNVNPMTAKIYTTKTEVDDTEAPIKPVPLRGWTSASIKGKQLGPPDPTETQSFEGFNSWILASRIRTTQHRTLGRVKKYFQLCVTGNGNGTAGFADVVGKSGGVNLVARAKRAAGQRLITVGRYEDRTVLHDFYARFGRAKIMVKQVPAGHGLICHRALKICCQAFGIKDIYAKSEGSDNVMNIIQAFFVGLLKQKNFADMAEEKKLHLVELRSENYFYPKVLASPSTVRTREEIPHGENLDYKQYLLDGKVPYYRKAAEPFFTKLYGYKRYLRHQERRRNQNDVRFRLKSQYGDLRSFLAEKYPEAKEKRWKKKREEPQAPEE